MGQTFSIEEKQTKEEEKLNNIKKLFNNNDDTSDILDTLNLTDFNEEKKKPLPMIGGFNNSSGLYTNSDDDNNLQRKRYTKYDLFKMLKEIDSEFQMGGNDEQDDNESSLNDEKSLEHIKSVILKELENLKNSKSQQLGGSGCGCDSGNKKKLASTKKLSNVNIDNQKQVGGTIMVDDSSSSTSSTDDSSSTDSDNEAGKKSKKSKKSSKKNKKSKSIKKYNQSDSDDNSSRFFIETSESGKEKEKVTSNGEDSDKKNDNEDNEDSEGLSIFPFNSSDVKSSLSIKNYRMLRRKI